MTEVPSEGGGYLWNQYGRPSALTLAPVSALGGEGGSSGGDSGISAGVWIAIVAVVLIVIAAVLLLRRNRSDEMQA